MKSFINLFISRPVFASMIILAMVVVGAAAYTGLGVDRYPSVDSPTVSVRTSLPGASPEDVEQQITKEIEEVVNTVDGIDELRSITSAGNSNVIVTFNLDRDIETAAQDVRDKVATVRRRLPEEAEEPIVSKFDNDSQPVITFALSGDLSVRELTEIGDKIVKVELERSRGVGEVEINGGTERTINITIDADRLASYRLPITAVREAIVRANAEVPGGNLTGAQQEASLRTMGRIQDPKTFSEIVIATVNGSPVRIRDIGTAEDAVAEQRSVSRLNGKPSVSVNIRRQSGANTIEVIDAVLANAEKVRAQLPPGVTLEPIRNQKAYIDAALHEINLHLVMGSVLACLVVFAFTRSWRSTIIAGVAIPASVITTFAMMWVLDFTLNSVTMLALVLMVGIVIDDAIVVLENIFRFVEEKKLSPIEAAKQGTAEIALAVLATTLSLAVIFVPVSFMSSISGRFLYQFGITAAVAVLVSLVVSFVLTPTLSARMLAGEVAKHADNKGQGSRGGFYAYIDRAYTFLLKTVMAHRVITASVAGVVILSIVPLFMVVQQGYLPQGGDEAEFQVNVEAPESISFAAMNDVMKQVEDELMQTPHVTTILSNSGGGFLSSVNSGDIYVRIPPHEERYLSFTKLWNETKKGNPFNAFKNNYKQSDVMQQVTQRMRKFKGIRVNARAYGGFNIGGGNFDIDFSVSGPDLTELAKYSADLANRARNLEGIDDKSVQTTLKLEKPEQRITLDRERASDLGISPNDIGTAIRILVGGDTEVTRYLDPKTNETYDVRLRLAEKDRNNVAEIPNLFLATKEGKPIELRNIATIETAISSNRIDRVDRGRDARVRATLLPGAALQDRTQALMDQVRQMNLPRDYSVSVRGAGREFERTSQQFVFAFALSIVFMYMILASQYENLIHPVTILLSLPLCLPFALLSLWAFGETLNLYSALGVLVLFGVVKKNSILQIDHMNHLRHEGRQRYDAVIEGNRDRLRPILMTTLALVAGMLPLALGTGPGAEERRAVAIVVIGGQTLSLLLTLLVTPVAYTLLDDLGGWITRRRMTDGHTGATTLAVQRAKE